MISALNGGINYKFGCGFVKIHHIQKQSKGAHKTKTRQERWHIKGLKNYGRFIPVSNVIRFIEFVNTGKLVKILPKCILFLQNMILNRAIRSISYDNRQIFLCFIERKEYLLQTSFGHFIINY